MHRDPIVDGEINTRVSFFDQTVCQEQKYMYSHNILEHNKTNMTYFWKLNWFVLWTESSNFWILTFWSVFLEILAWWLAFLELSTFQQLICIQRMLLNTMTIGNQTISIYISKSILFKAPMSV